MWLHATLVLVREFRNMKALHFVCIINEEAEKAAKFTKKLNWLVRLSVRFPDAAFWAFRQQNKKKTIYCLTGWLGPKCCEKAMKKLLINFSPSQWVKYEEYLESGVVSLNNTTNRKHRFLILKIETFLLKKLRSHVVASWKSQSNNCRTYTLHQWAVFLPRITF